jgi:hypothetical protein
MGSVAVEVADMIEQTVLVAQMRLGVLAERPVREFGRLPMNFP